MIIYNEDNINLSEYTAVTLGNFDGIHLGHQKLINTVLEYSKRDNLKSVVFSFYPHPVSVFKKDEEFHTILSSDEKEYILNKMGIDIFIKYPFTKEFANYNAEDFINILFNKIKCKVLVVGENYCFGKNKSGTYETLKHFGDKHGVLVIKIPNVKDNSTRVSSTRIRESIKNKNFEETNRLLNKPYFIMGKISEGKKIGRTIGFPTINIVTPKEKLLPPDGVYLTKTMYEGKILNSITNIGKNPTVNGLIRTVETYIFNFNKDIYGKEVRVCFYKNLRGIVKFNNVEELKNQISYDKSQAEKIFEGMTDFKII